MIMRTLLLFFLMSTIVVVRAADTVRLITPNATLRTQALYQNMKRLAENKIMFGHHDANDYGHLWKDESQRSDVKDVCGSHPAVYGHDFGSITNVNAAPEQQRIAEERLRKRILDGYCRGGINTITWHFDNPVNGKSFYYKDNPIKSVPLILPGGDYHEVYKKVLATIAHFASTLKDETGDLIPVIFRPYHEYDGNWFWWGVPHHCTREQFVDLWHFTIDYLRDTLKVSNFIYGFSPDCGFLSETDYLTYYPGDGYVDLIGMDNYWDLNPQGGDIANFPVKLKIISDLAEKRNKVAALTETGIEGIPEADWWTGTLLPLLKKYQVKLSYLMVWRNAYQSPTHYFAPFPGQISCADFIRFRNDEYILFENDLPAMYNFENNK